MEFFKKRIYKDSIIRGLKSSFLLLISSPKLLTADMHAEFKVDPTTELKHKAGCVWKLLGENYTKDQLAVYCALYGITTEEALLWKS
jgi:hypothetical protein